MKFVFILMAVWPSSDPRNGIDPEAYVYKTEKKCLQAVDKLRATNHPKWKLDCRKTLMDGGRVL